ncbi:MAG: hypothetical protein K2J00_01940, partial [Bacteroidaceae bacterium]|nr:hypothetical protein [Bacteroidaceae bacterium]
MKLRQILVLIMATAFGLRAEAAKVKVTMNTVSTTMTLTAKGAEQPIDIGEPDKRIYNFEAPAGEYVLTAFGTDGQTVNGTIVINIAENGEEQEFTVLTQTAYVTNKAADGTAWSVANGDYTIDVKVSSREGVTQTITVGNSVTAGRNTFLALNGNSYYVAFVPSEQHQAEGYTTLYKAGTLTFNVNVNGAIPLAADYSISVPADAELYVGLKFTHFTDFTTVEPKSVETVDGNKVYTYYLADGQTYNFRTWKTDGLT